METKGTTQEKGVSGGIKRVGGQWGVHPSHDICNTLSQIFFISFIVTLDLTASNYISILCE